MASQEHIQGETLRRVTSLEHVQTETLHLLKDVAASVETVSQKAGETLDKIAKGQQLTGIVAEYRRGMACGHRRAHGNGPGLTHHRGFSVVMAGLDPAIRHSIVMSRFFLWMARSSEATTTADVST
jgi:hypothetical protein